MIDDSDKLDSLHNSIKGLSLDTQAALKKIEELNNSLKALSDKIDLNSHGIEQIRGVIKGDSDWDREGLIERVAKLERELSNLAEERDRLKWVAKGMVAAATLLGGTNIATLSAVIKLLNELLVLQ